MNHPIKKVQKPIMEQSYQMSVKVNTINKSVTWGIINAIILGIVFYDVHFLLTLSCSDDGYIVPKRCHLTETFALSSPGCCLVLKLFKATTFYYYSTFLYYYLNRCPFYSQTFYNLEIIAVIILLINTLYHFYNYLTLSINISPVLVTTKQKKLLGIKEEDNFFKEEKLPKRELSLSVLSTTHDFDTTPMNLSATSWQSSAMMNSISEIGSPNSSVTSKSWSFFKTSPDRSLISKNKQVQFSPTTFGSNEYHNLGNSSANEPIFDENSLDTYLKEYEELENSFKTGYSPEPSSYFNAFWNHQRNNKPEGIPIIRPCSYQLAPPVPIQTIHSPGGQSDDSIHLSSAVFNQEVWGKVKVNPQILTQWNANLRLWISQTILDRLVVAMDKVNESLERQGLADMRLGTIGLERLKKTAMAHQVASHIPHLPMLVPFLELSPHQEYIVNRIQELAKGGSMSEYRWNSGGQLHGKDWDEHLPTDAALVMHLLATYLDSQLPPVAKHAEGRPFSSQYLVKTPDRPPTSPPKPIIYQSQINPPHYLLLVGNETLQLPKGRNNLFQTIILFLHQIKRKEDGMLGRVNLGRSGINLLWVIDS